MPRARVVLVHGLRTSATMWRRQLAALARHDVDAVAIDLPSHGARSGEPFTIDDAMRVIGEAVPERHADASTTPTLLVGLSLGGYLSIEFASRHPGRVDGLVAASCGTRPRGVGLEGYRRIAALIARLPDRGRGLNELTARMFLSPAGVDRQLNSLRAQTAADVAAAHTERDEARREADQWQGEAARLRAENQRVTADTTRTVAAALAEAETARRVAEDAVALADERVADAQAATRAAHATPAYLAEFHHLVAERALPARSRQTA